MMYKDKDKQREANRQAKRAQRRRDGRRQPKGMTSLGTTEGMTKEDNVIPKTDIRVIPKRSYIGAVPETPDTTSPKPQSHSPMMVGYVPPERLSD